MPTNPYPTMNAPTTPGQMPDPRLWRTPPVSQGQPNPPNAWDPLPPANTNYTGGYTVGQSPHANAYVTNAGRPVPYSLGNGLNGNLIPQPPPVLDRGPLMPAGAGDNRMALWYALMQRLGFGSGANLRQLANYTQPR